MSIFRWNTFLLLLALAVCLTGCGFRDFGASEEFRSSGVVPGSSLRTIFGTIYQASPASPDRRSEAFPRWSVLAETTTLTGLLPVSGARVYSPYDPSVFAVTDELGRFSLVIDLEKFNRWRQEQNIPVNVASGQFQMDSTASDTRVPIVAEYSTISAGGSQTFSAFISVTCGADPEVNLNAQMAQQGGETFRIKPQGRLQGECLLDGVPTGSISVNLYQPGTGGIAFHGVSDAAGNYSFEVTPGSYTAVIQYGSLPPLVVPDVSVGEGQTRRQAFQLSRIVATKGRIAGQVVNDLTGAPVAEALVVIAGTAFRTATDANGGFQFTGVPAGTYSLVIMRDGFQLKSYPRVVVP